jgi:hypothetical protein
VDSRESKPLFSSLGLHCPPTTNCLGPRAGRGQQGVQQHTASCAGQPEHGRGVSGRRSSSLSHEPPMRSGKVGRYQGTLTWGTFLRDITYSLCARSLAQSGKDRNPGSLSRPRSGSEPAASSTCQRREGGGCPFSVRHPTLAKRRPMPTPSPEAQSAATGRGLSLDVGRWTFVVISDRETSSTSFISSFIGLGLARSGTHTAGPRRILNRNRLGHRPCPARVSGRDAKKNKNR